MEYIGYIGLVALTVSWIPQSVETFQKGKSGINLFFLILVTMGSTSLTIYAISIGNLIFTVLNSLSTIGGLLNLYYKIYPREKTIV